MENLMKMMETLVPIIAILSAVALPVSFGMFLALTSIRSRHKENVELIKQGIIPPAKTSSTPNKYRSLRNGFLCLGIGLGIIIGLTFTSQLGLFNEDKFFVLGSSILIFLGIAYTLFFVFTKDKEMDA